VPRGWVGVWDGTNTAAGSDRRRRDSASWPVGTEPSARRERISHVAAYSFVDEWHVPAPVEAVYELLSCPRGYPAWWCDVFLHGEGDAGPAAPGKRARLVTRGRLPYRLHWELVCAEACAPRRLVSHIHGDFVGNGIWTLEPVESGTRATLEWRVEVRKPLVRHLTPLLRPIFAWNHRWAMARGQERIIAAVELRERRETGSKAVAPVR
jgi:uncharacterized protein YndB with AHSA1/START domain